MADNRLSAFGRPERRPRGRALPWPTRQVPPGASGRCARLVPTRGCRKAAASGWRPSRACRAVATRLRNVRPAMQNRPLRNVPAACARGIVAPRCGTSMLAERGAVAPRCGTSMPLPREEPLRAVAERPCRRAGSRCAVAKGVKRPRGGRAGLRPFPAADFIGIPCPPFPRRIRRRGLPCTRR
jgi:hypothetical protein